MYSEAQRIVAGKLSLADRHIDHHDDWETGDILHQPIPHFSYLLPSRQAPPNQNWIILLEHKLVKYTNGRRVSLWHHMLRGNIKGVESTSASRRSTVAIEDAHHSR